MVVTAIQTRLQELKLIADTLDRLLTSADAEQLPAMHVARLAVTVDTAAVELGRYLETLAAVREEDFPP
jgi:hypothetical protein